MILRGCVGGMSRVVICGDDMLVLPYCWRY
jgi:hypothetical protein